MISDRPTDKNLVARRDPVKTEYRVSLADANPRSCKIDATTLAFANDLRIARHDFYAAVPRGAGHRGDQSVEERKLKPFLDEAVQGEIERLRPGNRKGHSRFHGPPGSLCLHPETLVDQQ